MSALTPILLLGTLILVLGTRLLAQAATRGHARVITIEDYQGARTALDSVFLETAAIKRIFATDDMKYIAESAAQDVQRFFLKERKRLATQWLRTTQKQVAQLMDIHLRLASYTHEPSPRFEFKLTANYLSFILTANGLLVLLWLFGPFETFRVVSHTLRVAEQFCSVFSRRLEKVDLVKLGPTR